MPELTVAAALAVAAACSVVAGLDVRMKWPNDLYIDDAKLGGVIAETEAETVVLGVGINANILGDRLPSADFYRVTSLQRETGAPVDMMELLERALSELERRFDSVRDHGLTGLLPEWRARSMEIGRFVTVERAGETVRGAVVDIGCDGSLHIEGERGIAEVAPHGDVTVIVGAPRGPGEIPVDAGRE